MNKIPKNGFRFTKGEELANAISHGAGTVLAITGMIMLVVYAVKLGTPTHVVSLSIYGATLTVLYLSSTMNHSLRPGRAKEFFHNFDQVAIYLLIAGTYTPLSLIVLHGDYGWLMFGLQWGFAVAGIIAKLAFPNNFEKGVNIFFVISYIIMGWMLLFFIVPMFRHMPHAGLGYVFLGGFCYSMGTIFFKMKKLPYSHLVWHIFVIAGSILHWIAIISYVLPLSIN